MIRQYLLKSAVSYKLCRGVKEVFLQYFELAYLIIFSLLTVALIILKAFKVGRRRRGVVKMLASAMFLLAGAYGMYIMQTPYSWLMLVGLFFAFAGDLLLVFSDNYKVFIAGVLSFSAASLTLSTYSVLAYGFRWWSLLIFAAYISVIAVCQIKKLFSFRNSFIYLNIYIALVGLCGCLGLSVLFTSVTTPMVLFGLGCFMYLLSDIFLGIYMYRLKTPVIDAVNTALYFPGMFLIAISLIL